MKRKIYLKSFILPSVIIASAIPLGVCCTTRSTINHSSKLIAGPEKTPNLAPNGKDRYVIIDNTDTPTTAKSKPNVFSTDDEASDLYFTISCDDDNHQYYIDGIQKVVMCGEELVLNQDYEVLQPDPGKVPGADAKKIVHLLNSTTTQDLFTLYIFPQIKKTTYSCELTDLSEGTYNKDIASLSVVGDISYDTSFTVRIRINKEKWIEGWIFDDQRKLKITSGNKLLTSDKFEYQIDTTKQCLDVKIHEQSAFGNFSITPSFHKDTPKPTELYDLDIYVEGKLFETRNKCVDLSQLSQMFELSISPIDADGIKKIKVYNNSCKIKTEDGNEEVVPFTFNQSKNQITMDLSKHSLVGDVSLNIDIQGSWSNFESDSWKEIDTFEKFFGSDTAGFSQVYGMSNLDSFIGRRKEIVFHNVRHKATVVSTYQMPLAADTKTETQPSDDKAYFTFMLDQVLQTSTYPSNRYGYESWYAYTDWFNIGAIADHDLNCWYRTDPPAAYDKSSDIRDNLHDQWDDYFKKDFTRYVKPVANRTIVESSKSEDTKEWPEKYIRDNIFLPTATQLGMQYDTFKNCGYMLEKDIDGDRVFKIWKDQPRWTKNDKVERLIRSCDEGFDHDYHHKYWLATPASNNPGFWKNIEDTAYINGDGQIKKEDIDQTGEICVTPCFCV